MGIVLSGMIRLAGDPTSARRGALALTPEASAVVVGGGIGASILVGGSNPTIELQPFTVQQQTGINVAADVDAIERYLVC
jgi:Protein of unknown function (DUF992)